MHFQHNVTLLQQMDGARPRWEERVRAEEAHNVGGGGASADRGLSCEARAESARAGVAPASGVRPA
jgi:hypothetical protein